MLFRTISALSPGEVRLGIVDSSRPISRADSSYHHRCIMENRVSMVQTFMSCQPAQYTHIDVVSLCAAASELQNDIDVLEWMGRSGTFAKRPTRKRVMELRQCRALASQVVR